MGLEKNADAVLMECYAPLLVNVSPADPAKGYPKAWQWNTNLIGYDALRSFGSPSYYAQAMLGQNKGDVVLPAQARRAGGGLELGLRHGHLRQGRAHRHREGRERGNPPLTRLNVRGVDRVEPTATAVVLAGDPTAVNTLDEPRKVAPKQETVAGASASFRHTFPPHSLTILRLKTSPNRQESRRPATNPILWADVPDLGDHSRGRHLLHEQHHDAHEPGAADHEVEGPRELADRQLRL